MKSAITSLVVYAIETLRVSFKSEPLLWVSMPLEKGCPVNPSR